MFVLREQSGTQWFIRNQIVVTSANIPMLVIACPSSKCLFAKQWSGRSATLPVLPLRMPPQHTADVSSHFLTTCSFRISRQADSARSKTLKQEVALGQFSTSKEPATKLQDFRQTTHNVIYYNTHTHTHTNSLQHTATHTFTTAPGGRKESVHAGTGPRVLCSVCAALNISQAQPTTRMSVQLEKRAMWLMAGPERHAGCGHARGAPPPIQHEASIFF